MSELLRCRACGQPLPPQNRGGVWLPARKAEIFDLIDRHPGISGAGIAYHCGIAANTVRQHVFQTNKLLTATGIKIIGTAKGARGYNAGVKGFYRVVRALGGLTPSDRPASQLEPK